MKSIFKFAMGAVVGIIATTVAYEKGYVKKVKEELSKPTELKSKIIGSKTKEETEDGAVAV